MADEATNSGGSAPKAAAKRENAEQSQQIANDISGALTLIVSVAGNAEIAALLLARGYNAAKLQEGRDLQRAAQTAFEARQSAMGVEDTAVKTLEAADKAAREHYTDFRGTARASFTGKADRTALNLNGAVEKDRDKFITQAQTSYNNAQSATYAAPMATDGYGAATFQAALNELAALKQADTAQNSASGTAQNATVQRNESYQALMVYIKRLQGMARVALKKRPDLAGQLGL